MPLVIFLVAIVAALLWLLSRRRYSSTGLPGRNILSADVGAEFPQSRSITSERYGLTGKPDYVVRVLEGVVPVEIKSGDCPRSGRPHDSHRYQVAAYCLLLEDAFETNVPYGLIRYQDRSVRVEYTPTVRAELLSILEEICLSRKTNREQHFSHSHHGKCRACGYRETCSESLA
jgi:CRISPR-associated exonuclease Cas4